MTNRLLGVLLVTVLAVSVLTTACGSSSPTAPSGPTTLVITDPRIGTGALAERGRVVTVNDTGWLYDGAAVENKGRQFDSSAGRGPFTVAVGAGQVIAGWDQGLVGMRVGGLRRLVVPPSLGYGSQGSPPVIPGNATLVFDIELLSVQ